MEERERLQVSYAAEQQGLSYIELQLDPREGRNKQSKIRYFGVKIAKEIPDGRDPQSGMDRFDVKVTGGVIIFTLDPKRKAWFGDLLDDKEGYNRKWLASHIVSKKRVEENRKIKESNRKTASMFTYHVIDEKYKEGESPFRILDPKIKHAVDLIRKEMDGEEVSKEEKMTPLEEAQAKLEEMNASMQEKERKWEEEKKALLDLKDNNYTPTEIIPPDLKSEIKAKAAAAAASIAQEEAGVGKE